MMTDTAKFTLRTNAEILKDSVMLQIIMVVLPTENWKFL